MTKLKIGYFYRKQLNLYGDDGNVEILCKRAALRDFTVEVVDIDETVTVDSSFMKGINLVFMGGGPDSGQKAIYMDLVESKGRPLEEYVKRGGVGLFICGAYQLMGHYYKSADGAILDGLGIFDLYTQHFGDQKKRCVGNCAAKLSSKIAADTIFRNVNMLSNSIVGFCNHGGRTYLGNGAEPLGSITKGKGNNGEDKTEGILYNNCIGTYFHGPFLSRNAHIADYLIAKSLNLSQLPKLDDSLVTAAFTASKKLK